MSRKARRPSQSRDNRGTFSGVSYSTYIPYAWLCGVCARVDLIQCGPRQLAPRNYRRLLMGRHRAYLTGGRHREYPTRGRRPRRRREKLEEIVAPPRRSGQSCSWTSSSAGLQTPLATSAAVSTGQPQPATTATVAATWRGWQVTTVNPADLQRSPQVTAMTLATVQDDDLEDILESLHLPSGTAENQPAI